MRSIRAPSVNNSFQQSNVCAVIFRPPEGMSDVLLVIFLRLASDVNVLITTDVIKTSVFRRRQSPR